jgi:hypothetical protein
METAEVLKLNFRRLTRNPFFRVKPLEKFKGKCARCGRKLSPDDTDWYVHHLTYEHSCIHPDLIEIEVRRIRRGKEQTGKKHITKCEHCFAASNAAFVECQKRVIPLCLRCHLQEHRADIAEYKKQKARGEKFDRGLIRARVNARYQNKFK